MKRNNRTLLAACVVFLALLPSDRMNVAWAACDGVKIDKTTVEETRKVIERAGYKNVRDWRKGCDNTWHATAMRDGARVSIAVLPDGHVVREAD